MKRVLSFILVLSMVLGSFGMAFAADNKLTAGIEDAVVVKAVERLSALGIVDGMEDGQYHPELDVTREQFAKLVIEATGLGNAAKAAVGNTGFKDVEADRWSAGYITVAAGQGIIKGMPDGTFRPANKVTYGEAVTMLVRALGYKDEFLSGTWPGNYIAKAAELDITKKVTFLPSGFADRGAVAVMLNNTLDADVIKVETYEGAVVKYYESDKTLLEDKLSIDKVENIRVIATKRLDDSLDSDEVRLLVLKDDVKIDGKYYDKEDEVEVEFVEDINVEGLIGLEITGYFDDEVMIYSEIETPASNYIRGIAYDDEGDGTLLSLETFKYYDYDKNVKVYVNNEDRTRDIGLKNNKAHDLNKVLMEVNSQGLGEASYAYGTVVLEKGKVTFADLSVFEVIAGVVQDVNTDKNVIQYINTWDGVEEEDLNLGDYDEFHILALDGSKMEIEDIEVNDRIYFYEDAEDDDIAYVMVDQRELITGTLTSTKTGFTTGSVSRGQLFVDGKAYSLANQWTYSLDNMDSFTGTDRFVDLKAKLDDVFDEKVTVYRDTKGRVALMTTSVNETTDNYAVVLRAGSAVKDELKLWTELDETVTYEVDDLENGITMGGIKPNDIIKYDINSDGTIDVLAIVYAADGDQARIVKDGKDKVETGYIDRITTKSVQLNGNYYFNMNSSLYFDYSDYKANGHSDDEDLDVVVWNDFEDTTVAPNTVKVVLVTDGDSDDIQFMAFVDGYDNIASDDLIVGYLLRAVENKDDMTLTVIVPGKGEVKYTVSKTADKNLYRANVERPIVFTLSGDGIKLQDPAKTVKDGVEMVSGLVTKRSGNDLYVNVAGTETRFTMENNVVIYEDAGQIGKYDLVKDYPVVMLLQDGKVSVIGWDYNYKAGVTPPPDGGTLSRTLSMTYAANTLTVTNAVYDGTEYIVKVTGDAITNAIYSNDSAKPANETDTITFDFTDRFTTPGIYRFELLDIKTFESTDQEANIFVRP